MPQPPSHPADGIPTLTQRVEPEADFPVLDEPAPAPPAPPDRQAPGAEAAIPQAVLRAALQAEIEQAVQAAMQEAAERLRQRLEAELPAIVVRAMQRVRPG